tara:strand:+ start:2340 stop:2759 length:420 start_codon:yes stop_codon:yes gene_type:complete
MSVADILKQLDNDTDSNIVNLTSRKIKDVKNNMLQKLQLSREDLKSLHKKLKDYRYCTDLTDLQSGNYIRWISLKDPDNLRLTNGAFLMDIKIYAEGVQLVCKNNFGRVFQFKFDEAMIFQKLNPQEKVILSVLDYLDK